MSKKIPGQGSIIAYTIWKGIEVPQEAANEIISGFNHQDFINSLHNWLIQENLPLQMVEMPAF